MKKLVPVLAALCAVLAAAIVATVVLRGQAPKTPQTTAAPSGVTASAKGNDTPSARPAKTTAPAADTSAATTAETTTAPTAAPDASAGWQQAYRDYLSGYEHDGLNPPKFALIYLDGDDVPELAICDGNYHAARWTVRTYHGGLKEIGSFGGWGNFFYYEKASTIYSSYGNHGAWTANIYRVENGAAVSVWEGSGDLDEEGNEIFFDADGNPISEEEYSAQMDAAVPAGAQEKQLSYDEDGWEITAENIENYVK